MKTNRTLQQINLIKDIKEFKMKNILKKMVISLAAVSLVLLGLNAAVAGSQSNGNSIYEDGIDKLLSVNDTSSNLLVASSQSNGFSIYEEGIGNLLSANDTSGNLLVASSQSNGNSIYEDGIDKLLS